MNKRIAGTLTMGALLLLSGCTYEDRAEVRESRVLQICENWLQKAGYVVNRDEGTDWETSLEHAVGSVIVRVVDTIENQNSQLGYILTDENGSVEPTFKFVEPENINGKAVVFSKEQIPDKRFVHGCGVIVEGTTARIKFSQERQS